jgi:threonine/homoserine/homoserine lactone efflux protein
MDLGLLAQGTILGFTIAAAVGPIALLTIRRTLAAGWTMGMASGLGVATADAIYGGIAAFGLTAISDPLVALADPLAIVGGAALVVIGLRTAATSSPAAEARSTSTAAGRGLAGAYLSILGLTLTNPMTVLLFAAIVVSLGVSGTAVDAALLTAGFFLGSLAWWLVLVSAVAAMRSRITGRLLHRVTVISGLAIAAFGVLAVAAVVRGG